MAVYYFTILSLTTLGYYLTEKGTEKRPQKNTSALYLAAAFIVLTAIASFRYAIGFDYFSYRNIYEITSTMTFYDILHDHLFEPLYFIVCRFFSLFGFPFPYFLIFVNMFLVFVWMRFIYNYSKLPWLSVYLYITLQFFAYNMNLIRQSIAAAFFLIAFPYLKSRKLVPFLILSVIGGLFHNSLLFVLPLYFLLPRKNSARFVTILIVSAALIYLFFDPLFTLIQPVLPEKYAVYTETYFWNSSTWEYAVPSLIYALFIYVFRHAVTNPIHRTIYLNSALYNLLISVFITKHFILERFSIYPFVFSLIAVPEIAASYSDTDTGSEAHGIRRRCVLLLFMLSGGAYFLFAAFKGFHNVYPYISLFDKASMPS